MAPTPARRWPIYPIRLLAVVLVIQVFIQAALAGGFISGNVKLLGLHSANAILIALLAMILVFFTVLLAWPGRGPKWPIPVAVLLWIAIVTQIGLGYARQLGGHVPLGATILGCVCVLTWWSFSYRPAR